MHSFNVIVASGLAFLSMASAAVMERRSIHTVTKTVTHTNTVFSTTTSTWKTTKTVQASGTTAHGSATTVTVNATPTVCLANQIGFGWDSIVPQAGSKQFMHVSNDMSQALNGNSFLSIAVPANEIIIFYNSDIDISESDSYNAVIYHKSDNTGSLMTLDVAGDNGLADQDTFELTSDWHMNAMNINTKGQSKLSLTWNINCGGQSATYSIDSMSVGMGQSALTGKE